MKRLTGDKRTGDKRNIQAILLLRRRLSSGGGKLLAFSWVISYETTLSRKVTVKPFIHTTAGTILIIVSQILLATLGRIEPAWQRYLFGQS